MTPIAPGEVFAAVHREERSPRWVLIVFISVVFVDDNWRQIRANRRIERGSGFARQLSRGAGSRRLP